MKPKKIPMRLCLGCGEMKPKRELIRVVKAPDGEISLDTTGKKSGRGAYICPDPGCLEKAQKARRPAGWKEMCMMHCSSSLQQLLGLVTICRKAGKLICGFDPVGDAVKAGKAACVLLTRDASPRTVKEARFRWAEQVSVLDTPLTMEQLEQCFHRKVAVMAVCDGGFARRFVQLLEPEENNREPGSLTIDDVNP